MRSLEQRYQGPHPHNLSHPTNGKSSKPSKPSQSHANFTCTAPRTQKYDVFSGQVYRETVVPASKRQWTDWVGELKTPALVKAREPNAKGPRSLLEVAKATVARQMRGLSPEHLADVPWQIAEQVWKVIEDIRSESFHAWRNFATAYPDHFKEAKYRYMIDIKQPGLPLDCYFRGVNSPTTNWLTCLRLASREMAVADVVLVAGIKNLVVLDLSDGHVTEASRPALDERLFKTWAELAVNEDAFRQLRVLMLGWQELLSKWIFKYLDNFPSLCYVLVTDSMNMHQKNRSYWEEEAAKYGWVARSAKKSAKSLKPLLDEKKFYAGTVSNCYYDSQALFEQIAYKERENAATLPILECWLGGPKRWTHIVEEFPGTRTIWFDNVKVKPSVLPSERAPRTEHPGDQNKRDREVETPTKELRSPPAKRNIAKRKAKGRTAASLLAEFGHVNSKVQG